MKKWEQIIAVIGLIASCIGIFVFLTGWQDIWDIFQGGSPRPQPTNVIQIEPTSDSQSPIVDTVESTSTPSPSGSNTIHLGFGGDTISAIVENSSGIYIGTDGFKHGVFHSTDSGKTWNAINNGLGNLDIWNLALDTSGNLYAGGQDGLWTSRDEGKSWLLCDSQMNTIDPPYTEILASAYNPQDGSVWAIVGSQISGGKFFARSTDFCSTWETFQGPDVVHLFPPLKIIASPNQSDWLFILAIGGAQSSNAVLWRSDNGGQSWQEMASVGAAYDVADMAVSWENPRRLFAGTNMGVYRSDDGGYSWQPINNGLPNQGNELSIIGVATQPTCNDCVAITTENEIFYTSDAGNTWSSIGTISSSSSTITTWIGQNNPNILFIGSNDGLWSLKLP